MIQKRAIAISKDRGLGRKLNAWQPGMMLPEEKATVSVAC
jgi:hypothetical protein